MSFQRRRGQEHWSTGEDHYDQMYSLYSMHQVLTFFTS